MEFFNQKEDVMDTQLTQYGKYLLSRGKFKPKYYAFFDQDIMYDGQYGGVPENANQAQERIKDKTPRLKAQHIFRGAEANINANNETVIDADMGSAIDKYQITSDKDFSLTYLLGTMDVDSIREPAWELGFYKAPLSSSALVYSGSTQQILPIPQLETVYTLNIMTAEGSLVDDEFDDGLPMEIRNERDQLNEAISDPFNDGSYFRAEQDYLFLEVQEKNGVFMPENFDIEVFEIETVWDEKLQKPTENLRQLSFFMEDAKVDSFTTEDILKTNYPTFNPNFVEYYFNIYTDQEIENAILCEVKSQNKVKDLFADSELDMFCPDADFTEGFGQGEYQRGPNDLYTDQSDDGEAC